MKRYFRNQDGERINFCKWIENGQKAELLEAASPRQAHEMLLSMKKTYHDMVEIMDVIEFFDLPAEDCERSCFVEIDARGISWYRGTPAEVLLEARRRIDAAARLAEVWVADGYDVDPGACSVLPKAD